MIIDGHVMRGWPLCISMSLSVYMTCALTLCFKYSDPNLCCATVEQVIFKPIHAILYLQIVDTR